MEEKHRKHCYTRNLWPVKMKTQNTRDRTQRGEIVKRVGGRI